MPDPTPALLPVPASLALVAALLALARAATQAALRRRVLAPESARRAVQAAASGVALALPWLFDGAAPVVALGTALTAALVLARQRQLVAVPGLDSPSTGSVAFPLSVGALYVLTADQPVLYAIPLLLVGLAGPAASFAGTRSRPSRSSASTCHFCCSRPSGGARRS